MFERPEHCRRLSANPGDASCIADDLAKDAKPGPLAPRSYQALDLCRQALPVEWRRVRLEAWLVRTGPRSDNSTHCILTFFFRRERHGWILCLARCSCIC
jgi:hypothetical protein